MLVLHNASSKLLQERREREAQELNGISQMDIMANFEDNF